MFASILFKAFYKFQNFTIICKLINGSKYWQRVLKCHNQVRSLVFNPSIHDPSAKKLQYSIEKGNGLLLLAQYSCCGDNLKEHMCFKDKLLLVRRLYNSIIECQLGAEVLRILC